MAVQSSMTAYKVADILKDVKVTLDSNNVNTELENAGDDTTLELNEIIESKILESIKQVHSIAPVYLLDYGFNVNGGFVENSLGNSIHYKNKGSGENVWYLGWIELPEDFMRLVMFEMSDWDKACFELKDTNTPEYKQQQSLFKGVRATKTNPQCFLSARPYGRILEFYPYNPTITTSGELISPSITRGVYIPYPKFIEDESGEYVYICGRCYNAVIYTICSLVATTLSEIDKSSVFVELAKSSLL